jgi:iron complex transport system ATP-binding protein
MSSVLSLDAVTVWRPWNGRPGLRLLEDITWRVQGGERWAVLGPNGAGKTTLLNVVGAVTHPSRGTVEVLGKRLGWVATATLRGAIGFVDPGLERSLAPSLLAEHVVLTGRSSTIAFLQEQYGRSERSRARRLLGQFGCEHVAERRFDQCSNGERKRILLARSLMCNPELLLLDEPAAGLDLAGRELLLRSLDSLVQSHRELTTVLVTHHPEELPPSTTHALLLCAGRLVAAGPVATTLTEKTLADCYGIDVSVRHERGRWNVTARDRGYFAADG